MKSLFLIAGYIVKLIGLVPSIILIAFLPLYFYFFYLYKRNLSILSTRFTLVSLLVALSFSMLASGVFLITSMSLGAWG